MVTKQQIAKAKLFPMAALLEYLGFMPAEQRGNELIYFSPFRPDEKTPSFSVNIKGNVFKDFGDFDKRGDVVRLYKELTGISFIQAVHDLCNNKINTAQSSSFVHYEPIITKEKKQAEIVDIYDEIHNKSLIHYLESRCINPETANQYCKEVHYKQPNGKVYHSIGFKNDSGGYELRSANFKSCVGKKDITTISRKSEIAIYRSIVFEGFFNFLSYLELHKEKDYFCHSDYIVLNSTSLVSRFDVSKYDSTITYLDNDISGEKVTEEIRKKIKPENLFWDKSKNYKTDLNDYLIKKLSK